MRNEFANFEQRTTVSNEGKSWTGSYFYGEQTYIEFFIAGQNPQFKPNESGIAFGVEQAGASDFFYNRLKEKFPEGAEKSLRTRKINGKDTAWFYDTGVDFKDDTATLFVWLMEYDKNYLKSFYPDLKPAKDGITRRQNLARRFNAVHLFKNIREITVALDKTEADRFLKELEAFDFKIKRKKNETIAAGQDVKFFIVPNPRANGITKLKIDLTRKKQGQKNYQFGTKSVLKFKGKSAVSVF